MKASIVEQPALRLITAKSKCFREGNREAMRPIESRLDSLNGRRFYGLVYESTDRMEYFAGLVPHDVEEEQRFVQLGFTMMEVGGGVCARVKLLDWSSTIDQIGPTFGAMIREYGMDTSRPQMEFYRSMTELHLLLPMKSDETGASDSVNRLG